MNAPAPGLGTRLRHLLELLDGDVQAIYDDAGLKDYRPRYTPILRALQETAPLTIKAIAARAGITHSAASQTVAQMLRAGLLVAQVGQDARERAIGPSAKAKRLFSRLHEHWRATEQARWSLEDELGDALGATIDRAIAALERRPFRDRIRECVAIGSDDPLSRRDR